MEINCPGCSYAMEINGTLLPAGGMEGVCPRCRSAIPLGGWQEAAVVEPTAPPEVISVPVVEDLADLPEEGRVSFINIVALITLVDSTLSLIGRLPGLPAVMAGGTGLTFHQQAKYLYDTCMAAGFFISVFGLMTRKNWARLLIIWLFGLGLAEGLYMLAYQQFAIAELERNLHEGFPELKKQQSAKLIGCALYAFFIFKLNTRKIKARFS